MNEGFAHNVRCLRKEKHLTQTQLAALAGVKKSQISAIESQQRLPSIKLLIKLASIFNVSIEYLLGIGKNNTIDVSALTPEQIAIITSLIEQFEIFNEKK